MEQQESPWSAFFRIFSIVGIIGWVYYLMTLPFNKLSRWHIVRVLARLYIIFYEIYLAAAFINWFFSMKYTPLVSFIILLLPYVLLCLIASKIVEEKEKSTQEQEET